MGTRGEVQKGFLLTIIVIIGVAVVVSYMGARPTGRVVDGSSEAGEGDDTCLNPTSSVKLCLRDTLCACNFQTGGSDRITYHPPNSDGGALQETIVHQKL